MICSGTNLVATTRMQQSRTQCSRRFRGRKELQAKRARQRERERERYREGKDERATWNYVCTNRNSYWHVAVMVSEFIH